MDDVRQTLRIGPSSKLTAKPSTSKSKSKSKWKKANKSKFVPKPKQVWRVKQPTRNWLELPSDIMADILCRIGVIDILENAQKVCTNWRKICKEPSMWRVIKMNNGSHRSKRHKFQEMCKNAVDRSQGQLLHLSITDFCNAELLQYISDRSSQLRQLEIIDCISMYVCWGNYLKKLPLLEELSLGKTEILKADIESVGRYCPMLKTLKVKQESCVSIYDDSDEESTTIRNELAVSIGKNLHELRHLELINNTMTNIGLQTILDGCPHLESLDLCRCLYIDLKGDLGKRCSKQIKYLKLPHDSLDGLPQFYDETSDVFDYSDDDYDGYFDYDDYDDYDDYHGYFDYDYDDYDVITAFGNSTGFEDLNDMLAFMASLELSHYAERCCC